MCSGGLCGHASWLLKHIGAAADDSSKIGGATDDSPVELGDTTEDCPGKLGDAVDGLLALLLELRLTSFANCCFLKLYE